jgi:hypothetical protein
VPFEGTDFLLDFDWNGRASAWFLSVYSADEAPLVLGIKVVSNRPLLHRFRSTPGLPAGDLVAVDFTGLIPYAGFDRLGAEVAFKYLTSDETIADGAA